MSFDDCIITKKTKVPLYALSAFSILIVVGLTLASGINIDKSFADKVSLLPLNSTSSQLNKDMAQFYSCIEESVENSEIDGEPHYFKEEPTKTEVALCYNDAVADKK